jgi:glutamine phosphoribosylpyrophosphate amidotransferase
MTIENVEIHIQDYSGNWRTVPNMQNQSQQVLLKLKPIQSRYPDRRVGAVDDSGRLIDLLD